MSSASQLQVGLYEQVLDEELGVMLEGRPDLIATLVKIDDESSPHTYSQFIAQLLHQALPISKPEKRVAIINSLIDLLSAEDGLDYTKRKRILNRSKSLLQEVRTNEIEAPLPRPETSLRVSSLLTGSGDDPQLEHELRAEMMSADRVDILVSFIKWSGLRLLVPAFENLSERGVAVRIITTSYMGASDPEAIEWLAAKPRFSVKVSYDTERTRLHAKAYHFVRRSGFSTAYIGSANMSRAAMTSGLEWTVKVTTQDMPHIMERFSAEFETYWSREEFVPYDQSQSARFREAISFANRSDRGGGPMFFADIRPYPFQERILEALIAARQTGSFRNLVIAATGTGKTVMAAFDYARGRSENPGNSRLLFVAHRKEILQQARACFRSILRDQIRRGVCPLPRSDHQREDGHDACRTDDNSDTSTQGRDLREAEAKAGAEIFTKSKRPGVMSPSLVIRRHRVSPCLFPGREHPPVGREHGHPRGILELEVVLHDFQILGVAQVLELEITDVSPVSEERCVVVLIRRH